MTQKIHFVLRVGRESYPNQRQWNADHLLVALQRSGAQIFLRGAGFHRINV